MVMNCQIDISMMTVGKTKIKTYSFDDYRVAQAICNLLDNVAECNKEDLSINYIHKELHEITLE